MADAEFERELSRIRRMRLLFVACAMWAAAMVAWRQPSMAAVTGDWPAWLIVALAVVSAFLCFAFMRKFGELHPAAAPLLAACALAAAVAATLA
ncbi:hypothetical protein ABGB18_33325 [Nonomuraea sp. B12E4]|uniref:hypothetical protein n=1 Tax=Nonomuraea sp. B12E4 TaxID=3153564 RepID=UPI00325F3326